MQTLRIPDVGHLDTVITRSLPARESIVSFGAVTFFLVLWQILVVGEFSWAALAAYCAYVILCMIYGRAVLTALATPLVTRSVQSADLLVGYLSMNSLLFFLVVATPYGIHVDFILVLIVGIGLLLYLMSRGNAIGLRPTPGGRVADLIGTAFAGVAATFWCSDSLSPPGESGSQIVYRTWQDTFIHARYISTFAQAHGLGSVSNIQAAGIPAPLYHYGSYISPSLISWLTGIRAIDVYSCFQLPFGIFLTGLAAFTLASSLWGLWPGLAATVALLALPDADQQGFQNKFLSYNFMDQVNLGGLYGIACVAVAWVFMLDGCIRGKYASVLAGYGFAALSLFYKAHIFVANAFLIGLYPFLFFPRLSKLVRLALGVLFSVVFVVLVHLAQLTGRVPTLRLDGSGQREYGGMILHYYDRGPVRDFLVQYLQRYDGSFVMLGILFAGMIILSTFGLWIAGAPIVLGVLGRKYACPRSVLFFPVLVVANYFVMSAGLAMDKTGIGAREELLNRPLVWAYFALVSWTAGAGYYVLFGSGPPRKRPAQVALAVLLLGCLYFPATLSRNLQTLPDSTHARFQDFNAVPACLARISDYVRTHALPTDIVQDSDDDPHFFVTALSERQAFVIDSFLGARSGSFGSRSAIVSEKLAQAKALKAIADAPALRRDAAALGIDWYIAHPADVSSWPPSVVDSYSLECGGYRLYHFT